MWNSLYWVAATQTQMLMKKKVQNKPIHWNFVCLPSQHLMSGKSSRRLTPSASSVQSQVRAAEESSVMYNVEYIVPATAMGVEVAVARKLGRIGRLFLIFKRWKTMPIKQQTPKTHQNRNCCAPKPVQSVVSL